MIDLFRVAAQVQEFCQQQNWPFCFIGGIAVQRWGRPRVTQDVDLTACSAEDLIVLKAFADRPQDWFDISGIIVRQGKAIDWGYVEQTLAPLAEAKDSPEILDRLLGLRESPHRVPPRE